MNQTPISIPAGEHRKIEGVATSIVAFIGWAPAGPLDRPQQITSWIDYVDHFGGLDTGSFLGYAVSQFFSNGGQTAYIIRIASADQPGIALLPDTLEFESSLGTPGTPPTGALRIVDQIDLWNLLFVPGETNLSKLQELESFCETHRAFLIADCDFKITDVDAVALRGLDIHGPNAAVYFPWLQAPDPLDENHLRLFPPSGFVAGAYAASDISRGVWKSPAGTGTVLKGTSETAILLNPQQIQLLNSAAVNCIRTIPQFGVVLWGARTADGSDRNNSEWKFISIRRVALFIEESLLRGLKWATFEPNDEPLWAEIRLQVSEFLQNLFREGAFAGTTPRDSFFVKCDKETTTADDQNRGIVNVFVGFAGLKPAEFIVIQLRQQASLV